MTTSAVPVRDDGSTRERMLDVALEAFSELGYEGASTRAIASRAGVNQGMIPYYFGSKEALWREAVDRAFAELRGELDPLLSDAGHLDDPSARHRAEELLRRLVGFVARRPAFARLMSEEGKREGTRMHWIVERHVRPLFETTREMAGRALFAHAPEGFDIVHFYMLIGAATQIFHQAPECRRLSGRDPTDPATTRDHADALIALFLPPAPEAESAHRRDRT